MKDLEVLLKHLFIKYGGLPKTRYDLHKMDDFDKEDLIEELCIACGILEEDC